mmetsp:Transcript_13065/g.40247  ORF Transcript_13065/g.40247 Transcript_13065/m.40247 type:complete len:307 (+) Transcript_13065:90-1010(+)
MAHLVGLAENGRQSEKLRDEVCRAPSSFLLSLPRGGYTAARTVGARTSIPMTDFHLKRIRDSRRILRAQSDDSADLQAEDTDDEAAFLKLALTTMSAAMRSLESQIEDEKLQSCEAILVAVVTLDDHPNVHAMAVLERSELNQGVGVEVRYGPRRRPVAKDTQWARERKRLDDMRHADVDETILADENGRMLEGATSNLFMLMDDGLYTAPSVVLPGHIRDAIIEICPKLDIPVHLVAVHPDTRAMWRGAFLTNGKRIIHWIRLFKFPERSDLDDFPLKKNPLVDDLEAALVSQLLSTAKPLPPPL